MFMYAIKRNSLLLGVGVCNATVFKSVKHCVLAIKFSSQYFTHHPAHEDRQAFCSTL